ncbi:MAG: shikimate kinase [Proteobacteria bacterium]|nr:MAG: shikimate kinase [Pseudomonadota bacterium]
MRVRNIILVGPMGVGKTTVGKALARILSMSFVDCDVELEQRTGVSVTTIFEIEGEEGFRRRESELLKEIVERKGYVVATGGGVIMCEENRAAIRSSGLVIYLTAPVNKLLKRTRNNRNRPLLQTTNPEKTLNDLMVVRDPLYRSVADLVIRVDDRSPQSLAHRIHETIESHENASSQPR